MSTNESKAAAFLRGWAVQAEQEGLDGETFLAAAQQQLRKMAGRGVETDGKALTQLRRSLTGLDPEELKRHLELMAWAIEAIETFGREDAADLPDTSNN